MQNFAASDRSASKAFRPEGYNINLKILFFLTTILLHLVSLCLAG
jgi:hypothetical protein